MDNVDLKRSKARLQTRWNTFENNKVKEWSIHFTVSVAHVFAIVTEWQWGKITRLRNESVSNGRTWPCYSVSHPDGMTELITSSPLYPSMAILLLMPTHLLQEERREEERGEEKRRKEKKREEKRSEEKRREEKRREEKRRDEMYWVYFTDRKASKTCRVTTTVLTGDLILVNAPEDDGVNEQRNLKSCGLGLPLEGLDGIKEQCVLSGEGLSECWG